MNPVPQHPKPFALDRSTRDDLALFLAEAALAAGPAVMEEYERGCEVRSKEDGSPVTTADHRAESIICGYLARLAPSPPICAEELIAAGAPINAVGRFLLVDPLDGTREFLARNGQFTINVALIEGGAPIAGAVYAPAIGRLWIGGDAAFVCEARPGAKLPDKAERRRIQTRRAPETLIAFVSRSHADPRVGILPETTAGRRDARGRLVAQILPHRRGSGRRLSPFCPDNGMGYGGRRRRPTRRWRRCARSRRKAARLWQGRPRPPQRSLHRLG